MVRMSDILRRIGIGAKPEPRKPQEEDKPKGDLKEESGKGASGGLSPEDRGKKAAEGGVRIAKAMTQREGLAKEGEKISISQAMRDTQLDPADSQRIYGRGRELMEEILKKAQRNEPPDLKEVCALIESIVQRLVLGDNELLSLAIGSATENYLAAHSLNVTILSVEIGLGKGYNKSRLSELGLCAFLYDIGMAEVMDLASQPRLLSKEEYARIKQHPLRSQEILRRMEGVSQAVLDVARQHHERLRGQGYPDGLRSDEISEYSRIISLCDVYEALIHARPHRTQLDSHDAIKQILAMNSEGYFDAGNVKVMIKKLGIFPVGSWVELNTGEIGKVISANEDFPLRPNLSIIFNMNKQRYPQAKMAVLPKQQSIYIKRPVDLRDLGLDSQSSL